MEIIIHNDVEELSHAAAKHFVKIAQASVAKDGRFSVVLTGGSSPKRLYQLLSDVPYRSQVPWQQTHVFFGDERWVHHDDARNNARMAYELLLNHVPIPGNQIVRMSGELSPEDSTYQYESILQEFFLGSKPVFDLVLLGMGEDGHTLSLFPGTDVVYEKVSWVKSLYLEDQNMHRITLTAPIVNEAQNIVFLVMGNNKAEVVKKVVMGGNNPPFPAELIKPQNGNLTWFLDKEAGSALPPDKIGKNP